MPSVASIMTDISSDDMSDDAVHSIGMSHTFRHIISTMRLIDNDFTILDLPCYYDAEHASRMIDELDYHDILFINHAVMLREETTYDRLRSKSDFIVLYPYDPPITFLLTRGSHKLASDVARSLIESGAFIPVMYSDYVMFMSICGNARKIVNPPIHVDVIKDIYHRSETIKTKDVISYIGFGGNGFRLMKHVPVISKFSDRRVHIYRSSGSQNVVDFLSSTYDNLIVHEQEGLDDFVRTVAMCEFMVVPCSFDTAISPIAISACVRTPVFSVYSNYYAREIYSDLMISNLDDIDVNRIGSNTIDDAYSSVDKFSCSSVAQRISDMYRRKKKV